MSDLSFLEPWFQFFTTDITLRTLQAGVLLLSSLLVFFVFYATRDILLRTHSFLYQIFCILLVAFLPFFGFLIYLLIRPARTVKEREQEAILKKLMKKHGHDEEHHHKEKTKKPEEEKVQS